MISVKGILALFVSRSVFDLLFIQLNKYNSKILFPLHRIPDKLKGKWYIKWIFILALVLILAVIEVYVVNLGYVTGSVIVGFIISICDYGFKVPKEAN